MIMHPSRPSKFALESNVQICNFAWKVKGHPHQLWSDLGEYRAERKSLYEVGICHFVLFLHHCPGCLHFLAGNKTVSDNLPIIFKFHLSAQYFANKTSIRHILFVVSAWRVLLQNFDEYCTQDGVRSPKTVETRC